MRTRMLILTGALLVASAGFAQAQDTTPTSTQVPAASAAPTFTPKFGTIDFGYRGTSFTGDEARYNRLRDLRDGGYINRFRLANETERFAFKASANNVGYRDQQYLVNAESIGKVKASFLWNSIPLYQAQAQGFYSGAGTATETISADVRGAIQNGTLTQAQAFAQFATPYDIKSRRDNAAFDMTYTASRDVDLKVLVRNSSRSGSNLQSYGFGNSPGNMYVLDMGVPVDDRTTDVRAKVEYANSRGLLAVGYDASYYNQNVPVYTWDNPLRLTDSATAGPAFGKTALWPTNDANSMNVTGSYKLPGRSRVSAAISYGQWNQNESLLPNTTNTALSAAALERPSAEAKADITSMVYGFNSRPVEGLWLNAKFRYYDYNNKTPEFTNTVVPGDYGIGALETSEPSSFTRKTLDLDASYSPMQYIDVGAGYTRENADRTFRIFEGTTENLVRLTADSVGNQYVTARVKYQVRQAHRPGARRGAVERNRRASRAPALRRRAARPPSRDRDVHRDAGLVLRRQRLGVRRPRQVSRQLLRAAGQQEHRLRRRLRHRAEQRGELRSQLRLREVHRAGVVAHGESADRDRAAVPRSDPRLVARHPRRGEDAQRESRPRQGHPEDGHPPFV